MIPEYLSPQSIYHFVKEAIKEDVGDGDHSTLASIPATAEGASQLIIKEKGTIAGIEAARRIFNHLDDGLDFEVRVNDGEQVEIGQIAFIVKGSVRTLLTGERLVLNCMQRMSGIATYTQYLSGLIAHTSAQLLDTRKTTPNFRLMEKWAVTIGGGTNHRFGLFDMIMLKDNHVDFAGGIKQAIQTTQDYLKQLNKSLRIEIETRTLSEVKEVLDVGGVDVIMLDNMSLEETREAVELINGKYKTEASGGVTENTIAPIAETGVDFISVGALTHSAKSMDMSLKAI